MKHAAIVTVGLILLATTGVSPNDQWPQFRGPRAGAVADDPDCRTPGAPPRTSPGAPTFQVSAGAPPSSGTIRSSSRRSSAPASRRPPKPGLYAGTLLYDSKAPHRWMVYAIDFNTGKIRWERELANMVPRGPKHLKNSFASETPVTDGERLYVYFGSDRPVRAEHEGQGPLDAGDAAGQRSPRLGHGRLARPPQGSALRRQRQR